MATEIDRPAITQAIRALTHGETDTVSLMATVACEIHQAHPFCDWTGFYRVTAPETLKIGPYQGGHGCLVIPFARGVCGAAARTGEIQLVADVEAFPGHIACSSSTRSGITGWVRMATWRTTSAVTYKTVFCLSGSILASAHGASPAK